MLQRAARNAYSWWWASHIRTKQSKWLDQNLQDMEEKVEHILKIIEEDGDSFAARAEMYYRKRPELLNFVEDSFRGYRALAERYDHLSKELQTANRTIATVYPEQVQLAIDDEDEVLSTSSSDNEKPVKNLPAAPKINIPRKNTNLHKKAKAPARLMSKKGLLKFDVPNIGSDKKELGMKKEEALQKIDEIQKLILGLQTEKEFVQSSYENGLKRFWEIEEKITEMQNEVSNLQDEYGVGTFIEDDEARTLMAATALRTCQEALIRLQDKQKQSDDEAKLEYERVKQVHEKLVFLKKNLGEHTNKEYPVHEKIELEEKAEIMGGNENELLTCTSVTMSEMAEKIDDLVEKVIILETALSSQNALVTRLRLETNELQDQIQNIEQDKEVLIEGSDNKNDKIIELEQELLRIKNLRQSFKLEKRKLQRCFTEASFTVDNLSEKLKTVKQDDEVQNIAPVTESTEFTTSPVLGNKENDAFVSDQEQKIGEHDTESGIEVKEITVASGQNSKNLEGISNENTAMIGQDDNTMKSNPKLISSGQNSETSKITGMEEAKWVSFHADTNSSLDDLFANVQTISDHHEEVIQVKKVEPEINGPYNPDLSKMDGQTDFSFNPFDCDEGFKAQVDNLSDQQRNSSNPFDSPITESETLAAEEVGSKGADIEHEIDMDLDSLLGDGKTIKEDDSAASSDDKLISEHGETVTEEIKNVVEDQVIKEKIQEDEKLIQSNPNPHAGKDENTEAKEEEEIEDDDQPDWKELFLNGLEDREKVLLQQYTATLRNYKETKKIVNEIEKKNHDSLFKSESKIKELKNANAMKDAEIQSLHRKLDLLQGCLEEENQETSSIDSSNQQTDKQQEINSEFIAHDEQKAESALRKEGETTEEKIISQENGEQGKKKVVFTDQPDANLTVEEKFRSDIDGLLEENIEFWLRFSTSFQQIQKFQTSVEDLHDELTKLKETQKDISSKQNQSSNSDIRPIYNHLREIQTELTLWVEENSLLEFDLRHRLASLSRLQGEISSISNAENKEEENGMSDYQAAKFQGEILIMKQENNQVAEKLKTGIERVKELQSEVSKTISNLGEQLGVSVSSTGKKKTSKSSSIRSKVPLKSFLFGAKLKKKKQSLFHCITPSLQKQYSDMHSAKT